MIITAATSLLVVLDLNGLMSFYFVWGKLKLNFGYTRSAVFLILNVTSGPKYWSISSLPSYTYMLICNMYWITSCIFVRADQYIEKFSIVHADFLGSVQIIGYSGQCNVQHTQNIHTVSTYRGVSVVFGRCFCLSHNHFNDCFHLQVVNGGLFYHAHQMSYAYSEYHVRWNLNFIRVRIHVPHMICWSDQYNGLLFEYRRPSTVSVYVHLW